MPERKGTADRIATDGPQSGSGVLLWVLWLTYGSFYFCRTNIAAAVPGIKEELLLHGAVDPERINTEIGWILASLKLTYGLGQFINGQLAERISPRKLLAVGMLGSAALNVAFGFGTGFYFLLFIWASNGYVQALGWTPTMRVAANWIPPSQRGRAIGLIGTGYQVTAALTYVVAGTAAEHFGWRAAMFIPAALLTASAIHMLALLRDDPESPVSQPTDTGRPLSTERPKNAWQRNLALTLTNPQLWLLAFALGLLNSNRYGFLDWGLQHMLSVQDSGLGRAALKYAVLPLGGIAGALVGGWATDRFFGGRRAPVIFALLTALGLLTIGYNSAVHAGTAMTLCVLTLVGFCLYGAQVLLVGTAPVDLARRGTAAAAVGFVNFMGYMGATAGDVMTGRLVDAYSWPIAVNFWAGCAFAAAVCVVGLWGSTAQDSARAT